MILTKSDKHKIDLDLILNEYIAGNHLNEILLLVPTNRKLRKFKKEIIDATPAKAVIGMNLETLTTLSGKLLAHDNVYAELSESAAMVFLERAAKEVKFKYFSVYSDGIPYGTLRKIKDVISEYKRSGVYPEHLLESALKLKGAAKNKAEDIGEIYKHYLALTENIKVLEVGDVYRHANNLSDVHFKEAFKAEFPSVKTILALGFDEFSKPEITLLDKLSPLVNGEIFLNFDYYKFNPQLFKHLEQTFENLTRAGFREIDDSSTAVDKGFKATLRENLFSNKNVRTKTFADKIKEISAPNRKLEIEYIAKEIKKLITDKNIPPHRICVAFNLISNYSQLTRHVFNQHSIPINITDRIPLDNLLPVSSVINLLSILDSDYYYKNILRAVSGGYIKLNDVDAFSLLITSRNLKIISGEFNWINRIKFALEEDDVQEKLPRGLLKAALTSINSIRKILEPFNKDLTIREFVAELKNLVIKTGITESVLKGKKEAIETNIKAISEFIEKTEEVLGLIEQEVGSKEKFGIAYYLNTLVTLAKSTRINIKERSDYGVLITNAKEIRGLSFDYLFLGGMIDKDFPLQYSSEVLVADDFSKGEENHLIEQRYLFYRTLGTWSKGLYLMYPLSEEKREFVQSSFLRELKKIYEIKEIDTSEYEKLITSRLEQQQKTEITEDDSYNTAEALSLLGDIDVNKYLDEDEYAKYNGILLGGKNSDNEEELAEQLREYKERIYSVSQLETYAACPFKYLIERILGIEPIEEPSEDITAIELGSVLHKILYDYYTKASEENISLPNCSDIMFERAKELLFNVAEDNLNVPEFNEPNAFWEREKLLGIKGNEEDSILYRFLETERQAAPEFKPKYFEVRFGFNDAEEVLRNVELNGVKLRGVIDRIEVDETRKLFNVVDYKSGKNRVDKKNLTEGLSLQLPVYLYAAQQMLGEEYRPHQMVIYSLKYTPKEFKRHNITQMLSKGSTEDLVEANEQIIASTGEKIRYYVERIAGGYFPLSQLEDRQEYICNYCSFSSVCRILEKENSL